MGVDTLLLSPFAAGARRRRGSRGVSNVLTRQGRLRSSLSRQKGIWRGSQSGQGHPAVAMSVDAPPLAFGLPNATELFVEPE